MIYFFILNLAFTLFTFFYFYKKTLTPPVEEVEEVVDYPTTVISPFKLTDLDDFETIIQDTINLVIEEDWEWMKCYINIHDAYSFEKNNMRLNILYDKEIREEKFKLKAYRFEFGMGYDPTYNFFQKSLIRYYHHDGNNAVNKMITKFIHQLHHNEMVKEREDSKKEILEKKSILDQILIKFTRDRKLDNLLD